VASYLSNLLAHPLTRGLPLDDPRTTELRARIIREKGFLRQIYTAWYRLLLDAVPDGDGAILEIGCGGGFLKQMQPGIIASEVFPTPRADIVLDARLLPFDANSLKAVLMVDVLHHLPEPAAFLREASRCVRPGGACLMIEPWNNGWARWVYRHLHHEPFEPDGGWTIPSSGPLSGANGALPWILFERDRSIFRERFPEWCISRVRPLMPFVYLASGGVSMRSLLPSWVYTVLRGVEQFAPGLDRGAGMFAFIALERVLPERP
jgi:SAM-dependent methyltransferase